MSVSGQWQAGAAYERLAVQLAFVGQYHLLDEAFRLPPVANDLGMYEAGWKMEEETPEEEDGEKEMRRRAWWAVFQLERFNGLAMGRPPIIKPGWHWVHLPGALEDGDAGRPASVDLGLALIMGQIIEQRTDMFRLFFPRVDRGTLFYDNQPTHDMDWPERLQRLSEALGVLERRLAQWHAELDHCADRFSARRHANLEIMGASCQIHLDACVLQIREHVFEDLLIGEEMREGSGLPSGAQTPVAGSAGPSSEDGLDFSAMFESHTGTPFDRKAYQRGYMARAKRPPMSLQFISDLDDLSRRCWDRAVSVSDETARL
ncbi:hypothetical protein GGI21_006647, partial [Coemansia aciculifera]